MGEAKRRAHSAANASDSKVTALLGSGRPLQVHIVSVGKLISGLSLEGYEELPHTHRLAARAMLDIMEGKIRPTCVLCDSALSAATLRSIAVVDHADTPTSPSKPGIAAAICSTCVASGAHDLGERVGRAFGFAMPDKAPRRHAEVLQTSVEENILGQSFHVRRTNATPSDVLADLLVAQAGGDADAATPWVEHVKYVYPNKIDHNHILDVLAYVVQNVGGKVNHALVMAGEEGIGKDTILKVLSLILGGPNVVGVGPDVILEAQFNPYAKSLVLVIAEARDLGNGRYKLNNKLKDIITTTSTGLYVNEKGIPQYSIPNHMLVCITTNFPDNGLYVNEGSRRYFVASSKVPPKDPSVPTDYFSCLHDWLEADGFRHVAAFLRARDLSKFDSKAPPPMNEGTRQMIFGGFHPDAAKMDDLLDAMGMEMDDGAVVRPKAVTIAMLSKYAAEKFAEPTGSARAAEKDFYSMMAEGRYPRGELSYRLKDCGFTPALHPTADRGMWKVKGKRTVVYACSDLPEEQRQREAAALAGF